MTFLTKDVADHLRASTNIYDAFGEDIYPEVIPQHRKDQWEAALVISDLSNDPEMSLGGEVGTHISIVQIDVWTDGKRGKAHANELGELIRNRLNGYRGQLGSGVYCSCARMEKNNSVAADPVDGSDRHRRRVSMDFKITHTASVPTFA
jgi:hypothetical protein